MKFLNKLVFFFYYEILIEIVKDKEKCIKIFEEFNKSLNSLSRFYIIAIFLYQVMINFFVLPIKITLLLNNKKKANLIVFNILKKLPFFKNINNFIFANLLLHYHE